MKNNLLTTSTKYRADIDGLRALAILSVVGFHAFPHSLPGGFIGVDVFFVISGFLISTILFENLENSTFSFSDFYTRRVKRIFPALLIVLTSCLVFGWFALFSIEYKQLGKHIAGGAGFISNFFLWQEAGYFDKAVNYKPLLHLWSLSIEEQFYIIWPLLLWLAFKKQLNLLIITGVILILSFWLNIHTIYRDAVSTFYLPHTRFWELLSGSLLAWFNHYKSNELNSFKQVFSPYLIANFLALLGFSLVLYAHFHIKKNVNFPGFWALLPILGAVLLIAAGKQAWINRYILANRFMVWVGLISFPLYLWHWPILSFIKIMEPNPSAIVRLCGVVLAVVLAWLTYKLIEIPIRFNSYNKNKTVTLLVLMSVIGGLGGIVYSESGLIFKGERINDTVAELIANPLPLVNDFECSVLIPEFKQLNFDAGCKLSKNKLPDIMFIGDSHTAHYRNAVWKQFADHSVLMIVQTSCLPFASHHFLKGECQKKYDAILSFLKDNSTVKKVYLSGYWSYLMTGGFAVERDHWRRAKPIDSEGIVSFQENGKRLIATILKSKKEVIFLKDIPDLDFNINSCFHVRPLHLPFHPTRSNCWINFADYQQRIAPYDQVINDLLKNFPQVKLFDPRPLFCNNSKCYARDAKFPYYFNGDHLNQYGAELVIKDMWHKFSSEIS